MYMLSQHRGSSETASVTVGRNTTCAFSNVWNVNLRSAAVVNRVKERVWIMYGSNCGGDLRRPGLPRVLP